MEELLEEIFDGNLEISTILCFLVMNICLLIAIHVSWKLPLYYNLFVVEMHTWTSRRVVQVLHLGQEFTCDLSWDRLMSRMRDRAPRIQGETRLAVSDTNIVIQSPNTVIDAPQPTRMIEADRITLWDIELPPLDPGTTPNPTRDSQFAAAAAIAILARGDDHNIRSRNFADAFRQTQQHNTTPSARPAMEDFSTGVDSRSITENPSTSAGNGNSRDEESSEMCAPSQEPSTSTDTQLFDQSVQTSSEIGEKVLIRLKFMSDAIRDTYALLSDTIGKYRGEHFKEAIKNNLVVRLIYQGQLLRDDNRTLDSYGVVSGSVLHCHISKVPYTRPGVSVSTQVGEGEQVPNRHRPPVTAIQNATIERQQPELDDNNELEDLDPTQRIIDVILLILVPIMAAFGLNFIGFNRGRNSLRSSILFCLYRWIHNFFLGDDGDARFYLFAGHQLPSTSTLFWIFAGQMGAVSIFMWFFPQVVDKTAIMLMVLLILYFIFVIWKTRERLEAQNLAPGVLHDNR